MLPLKKNEINRFSLSLQYRKCRTATLHTVNKWLLLESVINSFKTVENGISSHRELTLERTEWSYFKQSEIVYWQTNQKKKFLILN